MKWILIALLLGGCCKKNKEECMSSCMTWKLRELDEGDRPKAFNNVAKYCKEMQCLDHFNGNIGE